MSCLPGISSAYVHIPLSHGTSMINNHNLKVVTAEHSCRYGALQATGAGVSPQVAGARSQPRLSRTRILRAPKNDLSLFSVVSTEPVAL